METWVNSRRFVGIRGFVAGQCGNQRQESQNTSGKFEELGGGIQHKSKLKARIKDHARHSFGN